MQDVNVILYTNSKDQRRLGTLDTDLAGDNRINQVIGYGRFSVLAHGSIGDGEAELNGVYPVISAEMFNELYGKMLTLVDVAFPEGTQKEAFKALSKSEMSNWYNKHVDYTKKMITQAKEFTELPSK